MKPRGGHGVFSVGQEGDGPARLTIHGKDSEGRYTHYICGSVEYRLAVCPYVMKELRPAKWAVVREIQEEVDKKIEKREGL
jgi:predicted transcriptional regulator YdeE